MLIDLFKIKKLTLFISIVIYTPIGYFIYLNQMDKVIYTAQINAGRLSVENFCNVYNVIPDVSLIDRLSLGLLEESYTDKINREASTNKSRVNLSYLKDSSSYQFIFNGKRNDLSRLEPLVTELIVDLRKIESLSYRDNYAGIKLHCGKDTYSVFTYVEPKFQSVSIKINKVYNNYHLFLSSLSPLLLIYLLTIIFKYFKIKISCLMFKKYNVRSEQKRLKKYFQINYSFIQVLQNLTSLLYFLLDNYIRKFCKKAEILLKNWLILDPKHVFLSS